MDKAVAEAALSRGLGSLRFLEGLRSEKDGGGGPKEEACPVCQEPLGQELVMLPCGHVLCVTCSMRLAHYNGARHANQVRLSPGFHQ